MVVKDGVINRDYGLIGRLIYFYFIYLIYEELSMGAIIHKYALDGLAVQQQLPGYIWLDASQTTAADRITLRQQLDANDSIEYRLNDLFLEIWLHGTVFADCID